jgi:mitochondrial GTPase 1
MARNFIPRTTFPELHDLPRSYFLGHHAKALRNLRTSLTETDIVIEVRDYRLPLTSINPELESNLAGRERFVIYNKADLGRNSNRGNTLHFDEVHREKLLTQWHTQMTPPSPVFYTSAGRDQNNVRRNVKKVLIELRKRQAAAAATRSNLTGLRALIVGMPNVGKSTIINTLRLEAAKIPGSDIKKKKVAKTGGEAGVTRNFSELIKILPGSSEAKGLITTSFPWEQSATESDSTLGSRSSSPDSNKLMLTPVYLRDTPGVFIPYVPSSEDMLKLAICGLVKSNLIDPFILADYLLFQLNLRHPAGPDAYSAICAPTNDIDEFLPAVARYHGKVMKGGVTDNTAAAIMLVQKWRDGKLGQFILDDVNEETLGELREGGVPVVQRGSMNQARKVAKEMLMEKRRRKVLSE